MNNILPKLMHVSYLTLMDASSEYHKLKLDQKIISVHNELPVQILSGNIRYMWTFTQTHTCKIRMNVEQNFMNEQRHW